MSGKFCQIVIVGHQPDKLMMSIDKERNEKIIFITEKTELSGTKQASKALNALIQYYTQRKVEVENIKFSFHIQTKPIAELTHLIYQQKLQGYDNITVNLSGGLRYMIIWLYLACSITNIKVIHGDFIYEDGNEVGILKNDDLITIPFGDLTNKQIEFLKLFFPDFKDYKNFFSSNFTYDQNPYLSRIKVYNSIEELRISLIEKRGSKITRGSINGFLQKLNRISSLTLSSISENKKSITISYFGIAYFLHNIFKKKLK